MPANEQAEEQPTFTITADQLRELTVLAGRLHAEAEQCRDAGRWIAAIMLLGGTAEAALLGTVCVFEPELRAADLWPPRRKDPTTLTLGQLGDMARKAGWLPTRPVTDGNEAAGAQPADGEHGQDIFAALDGEVGDALRFVERVRNMIVHPGAYVREPDRPDTSNNEHMSRTYELIDGIIALILDHLTNQIQTLPG